MKLRKMLTIALVGLMAFAQTVSACTIFAVGKGITTDGSTIISHTNDTVNLDFLIYPIPSMPAGEARDVILNGHRYGSDYSQFPEVKSYGPRATIIGEYIPEKDTNGYIHASYSFLNDKGLAMGESTCVYDTESEQGKKLSAVYARDNGTLDCYMIQDLALENCSTAREAVELMGALIDEYGWAPEAESIDICDGNETWILEVYGARAWVAVRVPDDAVYVCANRARINSIDFNDHENYIYSKDIAVYALENDLWDGESVFRPNEIYCPYPDYIYCTRREWVAMMTLDPSLNLDPDDTDPSANWPLFVYPEEKVSVETIRQLCANYYQGTPYDTSKTFEAGPYGNPLDPRQKERAINCFRTAYYQISTIDASLPEEVRCLTYFGLGAPDTSYITPVFGSQTSVNEHYRKGLRTAYDPDSAFWNVSTVQQLVASNYSNAIGRLHEVRDPMLERQYEFTRLIQRLAASMIKAGNKDAAIDLLTQYSDQCAEEWFDTWQSILDELRITFAYGFMNKKVPPTTEWWAENVVPKAEELL